MKTKRKADPIDQMFRDWIDNRSRRFNPMLTVKEIAAALDAEGALELLEGWIREDIHAMTRVQNAVRKGVSLLEAVRDIVHPPKEANRKGK